MPYFLHILTNLDIVRLYYYLSPYTMKKSKIDVENGPAKEYYRSGKLEAEGEMKDGMKTGEWVYYLNSGNVKAKGSFLNGEFT